MIKYSNKMKEERAAVSVLVLITVLTFIIVLLTALITVTTLRQAQLHSDIRIQDIYGKDVTHVNEVFEDAMEEMENESTSTIRVGDKIYETLEEFLDNISNVEPGSTIKLVNDLDLTYIPNKEYPANVLLLPDNCVFDLQGNTIKLNKFGIVFEGNNITIRNGKFDTNASYAVWIGDEDETNGVVIENIVSRGGVNIYNSSNVILRNNTIIGQTYYAVWGDEKTTITIESGKYSTTGSYGLLGMTSDENVAGNFQIKGGEYTMNAGKLLTNVSLAPIITGGTYNTSINTDYISEGYELVEESEKYVVKASE